MILASEGAEKVDSNSKLLEFEVEFCGCGLSNNKPFYDGSHEITEDEDLSTVYAYDENHQREQSPSSTYPV